MASGLDVRESASKYEMSTGVWHRSGGSLTSRNLQPELPLEALDALEESPQPYDYYSSHFSRTTQNWHMALT